MTDEAPKPPVDPSDSPSDDGPAVPKAAKLPPKPVTPKKPNADESKAIADIARLDREALKRHEANLLVAKRWAPVIAEYLLDPAGNKGFQTKAQELRLNPEWRFSTERDMASVMVLVAVVKRNDRWETVKLPIAEAFGYHMGVMGLTSLEALFARLNERPYILAGIGLAWATFEFGSAVNDIAKAIIAHNREIDARIEAESDAKQAKDADG